MPNQTYHGQNRDSSTATNAKNKDGVLYLELLWTKGMLPYRVFFQSIEEQS